MSAACLEPNGTARGIGRERAIEHGLEDRIEFLSIGVESSKTSLGYDLALIPQPFLDPASFDAGARRDPEALRPGGWLLVLALDVPENDELTAASQRVRARLWGGGAVGADELIDRLDRIGYACSRAHPPSAPTGCSPPSGARESATSARRSRPGPPSRAGGSQPTSPARRRPSRASSPRSSTL